MSKHKKKRRKRRKTDPRFSWDPEVFRAAMAARNLSANRLRQEMALHLGVRINNKIIPSIWQIYDWRREEHASRLFGPYHNRDEIVEALCSVLRVSRKHLLGL